MKLPPLLAAVLALATATSTPTNERQYFCRGILRLYVRDRQVNDFGNSHLLLRRIGLDRRL